MAKKNFKELADAIVTNIGGEGNVKMVTHCVTRLRFILKDESKADTEAIKKIPGVMTVVKASGQYQVVIGNDVVAVYNEVTSNYKMDTGEVVNSHFDHTANLPDLFKQARPTVICDRIFARELSAAFQVPEACIRPIVPGLTYHFDDFTLNTFSGNHTDLGTVSNFDGGKMFADPENPMIGPLNSYGCLYNTNYAFTLKNGFFIGFAAGVDLTDLQAAWKNRRPGLLLRQRIATASAESYAEECASLGAQLVLPMHQDASCAENSDMNLFAQKVNGRFVQKNCTARMFNPQRLKWYSLESRICLDEN